MKIYRYLGLALASFPLLVQTSFSQDDVPDHKLSEFTFGNHITGDEISSSGLKGKVVAIKWWGTR